MTDQTELSYLVKLRTMLDKAKSTYDAIGAQNTSDLPVEDRVDLDIKYQAAWHIFSQLDQEYRDAIANASHRLTRKFMGSGT